MTERLPCWLRIDGWRVLVAGGGAVALRRARAMHAAGAKLRVVAPHITPALLTLADECCPRGVQESDLDGCRLAVLATPDAALHAQLAAAAAQRGILVNDAADGDSSDLIVPAHGNRGPVAVTVTTHGASAATAARLRDAFLHGLDPALLTCLEAAAVLRATVRAAPLQEHAKRQLLAALVDDAACAAAQAGKLAEHHHRLLAQAGLTDGKTSATPLL